ncbi:right-handed parallel beta-helix repeat-containing protein [Candidatus Roseilinea sp. NK_OTU-006]|nr:right-handed parallel beta-helix repeat-containing protein [Candidatus Roseilinea sp. NK_OTU-006]
MPIALAGLLSLAALVVGVRAAHAQLPPPTAQDAASDADYDPPGNWQTGDNGGFGMGPWTLTTTSLNPSENGHFVGDSTVNNGMGGDSNNDGDVNTMPGNRAWGLYANSGNTASAERNFLQPFTPGSVFEIYMDNGDVQVGGTVGFALRNAADQDLLEVYFVGGAMQYIVHGNTPIPSGVSFTREGVRVVITLTTATTYEATLTRLVDGAGATVSGALRNNPGPIAKLRLFNANAGSGSGSDLFFNRIKYYRGRVLNLDTGRGYLNIQPAIDDPATQAGHTISVAAGVYTGTITVTKPVAIIGAGPGQTVIQSLSPGVVVTQSNVTISNTSIVGTGSDVGITTTFGVTGLTVSNVHISNFAQGIALLGGHSHVIQNNVLTLTNVLTSVGVGMSGGALTPITNVLISGNVLTSSGYAVVGIFADQNRILNNQMRYGIAGVRMAGADDNVLANNLIENNASYAIYFAPDAPPLVSSPTLSNSGNLITGNVALNHPNDRGIQIINASSPGVGNQIINNTVKQTGGEGIFIGAGAGDTDLVIAGNLVEGVSSASGAVRVSPGSNVTITHNTISASPGVGVFLSGGTDLRLDGNIIISHAHGISATGLGVITVTNNQIERYGGWGVHVDSVNTAMVAGNALDAQGGAAGIAVGSMNVAHVLSNTIQGHTGRGVYGYSMGAFHALANTVLGGQQGIEVTSLGTAQVISNTIQGHAQRGIYAYGIGALHALTNTVLGGQRGVHLSSASDGLIAGNIISNAADTGIFVQYVTTTVSANQVLSNGVGLSFENGTAPTPLIATLNTFAQNITGVVFLGSQPGMNLTRNAIVSNNAGVYNQSTAQVLAECNWYGAASGPSGIGPGSGDSVSANVDYNPWLLSNDLNGPCAGATLVIEKIVSGPITPTTSWQFTVTLSTGTLAFTLPAAGGMATFTGLDLGPTLISETAKLGYVAASACSTGDTGGSAIGLTLSGAVTCTFTNTITPVTTVITVTPVLTNGWGYITETVGPGVFPIPFDIVLPPPAPTLGEASARFVLTDVTWRHMYAAPILTGTLLRDITVFEYRLRFPASSGQTPYINIGWDDDVTDSNTGFRGRLVYSPDSLAPDTWHIVDARNDPTPRWYTTLAGATACNSLSNTCTFTDLIAAYPNAAIHPDNLLGAPLGFIGIRVGGGSSTGIGYADGLRVGVGDQITLYDFEAAPPTTITLSADPTSLPVGNSATLTATVQIANGDPASDGTVVTFTTSLGSVSPVTATTLGGVATATVSSNIAGVATVTATVGSLNATALVTFTPGAPYTVTLVAAPTTLAVGNSSTLTATVTDQYGNAVADGTAVSFATTLGTLGSATLNTSAGQAVNTLGSTTPGVATVTATVGSLNATALVTFTPGAPYTVSLSLTPALIYANGISQSVAVATVTDQYGNPVPGVSVSFFAGVGSFSPTGGATNAAGQVTATLTSLTPAIENVFAVVSGVGFAQVQATYTNPPAATAPLTGTLGTLTQTFGVVRKGNLITYTVQVTNTGAGQLNNVLIYAPIPSGTTYVAGSASGGNYFGSSALLLSGEGGPATPFGPHAVLNAVTWAGNLPGGASHTLSYVVQVQILEGQVVNQPKVYVDNADTGIDLSSTVEVVAYKLFVPVVRKTS